MKTKRFFASLLALVLLLSCMNLAAAAADNDDKTDGLKLSKTATAVDGGYKIRLEAYTTGTITTTTSSVPVDVVLVLDQSGSMAYDFKGNETLNNSSRRQYALKNAVNNFIDAVGDKYDAATADHRISIVTFGTNASTLQGWTFVDTGGKSTLKNKVSGLPSGPSGATNAGAGMETAATLMGSGYGYTGSNTERQKVVVFFTDGIPTSSNTFSVSVANSAISAANNLKAGGVTIYSIGIFNSANPNEMYGASGFNPNSNGTVNSKWTSQDEDSADRPAGNRFLNLLSSNFKSAGSLGLSREKEFHGFIFGYYTYTYTITSNFNRTGNAYYLTADDSAGLNNIFQSISQNIHTADINLDSETVVKDVVSDYFDLPANTNDIKVYTAPYQGNGKWGADVISTLKPTVVGKNVTVTGFDFNENYIMEVDKDDGTKGNKLILEFTVTAREGFLGGNGVPTNGEDSGVYNKDGTAIKYFPGPEVDVPIADVALTVKEKNVYLMGNVTEDDLKADATATCNGVNLLDETAYTGDNSWKADFVTISATVTNPAASGGLTADDEYSIEVKVAPKTSGTATEKTGTAKGKINVFKPELTFKDSVGYYGDTMPTEFNSNLFKTEWKHDGTVSDTVTMIGEKPELAIAYTFDNNLILNGKINTKEDIGVDASVKINGTDVNQHTTFLHQDCVDGDCSLEANQKFLIHVKTCTLNVTKTGGADGEPYVFTVNKDGQKYTEVTVVGNGTQTIVELPVGTYTIEEDTGWSWRYNPSYTNSVELSATDHTGEITCTNTSNNNKWLNGFSEVVRNIFAPVIIS